MVHGFRVARLAETTSTNTVVAEEARLGAEQGLVVVADYQSAGRGRFDRRWEAPAGSALLFSVLLRPGRLGARALAPGRRHLVMAAVSLAVAEAAREVAGVHLVLKWPNDLLGPDGHKVAGVLAEAVQAPAAPGRATNDDDAVVVGVGLNVGWAPEGATSLEALAGRPVDRDALLDATLAALARLYGNWEDVTSRYRGLLATIGREVVVRMAVGRTPGGSRGYREPAGAIELRGTALDVRADGRLVLSTEDGLVEVAAGDVEHASLGADKPKPGFGGS
jgi:BirA family biotin operon repressor/biotin-[acetyl-CoA-carboxylase] ligase